MSKLARTATVPRPARGPLRTTSVNLPDTVNAEGRPAYARHAKSELFTLAVSNFVAEDTFYEKAGDRDERFRGLIAQVTAEDPAWVASLLTWLRTEANMRSASIVGAVEYGRALSELTKAGAPTSAAPSPRAVLASVMQRADEPAEALGYWLGRYGRPLPKWLKRALYDGAVARYNPYSVFKYDGQDQPVRFGDVIEMSQGSGDRPDFKWLLARRHGREEGDYGIDMIARRQALWEMSVEDRRWLIDNNVNATEILKRAGMTWESVSGWIQGSMDAKVWEKLIPSMGYMALLRNLRNFEEASISPAAAQAVIARLTDPHQVAKSRQLPYRFLSAYKAVPGDRYRQGLSDALDLSFANVPVLGGKTLVLIDKSSSMGQSVSAKSQMVCWEVAALFGIALARSQPGGATIVGFDHTQVEFKLVKGGNVLSELQRFRTIVHGGATYTRQAIDRYQKGHDRVVVISDEQQNGNPWGNQIHSGGVFAALPKTTHAYTINVAGHAEAHAPATGVRHGLAGLTDAVFKTMGLLETRQSGTWPWETAKISS